MPGKAICPEPQVCRRTCPAIALAGKFSWAPYVTGSLWWCPHSTLKPSRTTVHEVALLVKASRGRQGCFLSFESCRLPLRALSLTSWTNLRPVECEWCKALVLSSCVQTYCHLGVQSGFEMFQWCLQSLVLNAKSPLRVRTRLATLFLSFKWPSGVLEQTGSVCSLILSRAAKLQNALKLSSANAQTFFKETWVTLTISPATCIDVQSTRAQKIITFSNTYSTRNTCHLKSTLWGCRIFELQDFKGFLMWSFINLCNFFSFTFTITLRYQSISEVCPGPSR